MPLRDGQWFLIDQAERQMTWIYAVCGGHFNDKSCPFLLGIKTGIDPSDILFVKAAGPEYVETAILGLFQNHRCLGGKGLHDASCRAGNELL
eukprot:8002369-Karenia_brevis.AAC.1